MFSGLSAFPLTPASDAGIDDTAYERLIIRLAESGVDSIGALGSTGGYAYLSRAERSRAATIAVQAAGSVPVVVGVGAVRTREVLAYVEDAQNAGAAGLLLAPLTYQPLTDDEVHGLYEAVTANASVPVVVYDNPATTHVFFSDELHGRIAQLPGIASIKIPPVSPDPTIARERVQRLRALIPAHVTIGVSGDGAGANGLLAGCDAWYSVVAGILPRECAAIAAAAIAGETESARTLSARFDPIWTLFTRYGSYRVAAAIAESLGLLEPGTLPAPVQGLDAAGRKAVADALRSASVGA